MPEEIITKGLFASIGFIATSALTAIGIHVKGDREFRKDIHKKVDKHIADINKNFPDNENFKMMCNNMNSRFDKLDKDIREIRGAIK